PEFVEKLEKYLKSFNIKSFDYSQFGNPKRIGQGGFAVVYSATFDGQIYALKSLNMNLKFEEKEFRLFKHSDSSDFSTSNGTKPKYFLNNISAPSIELTEVITPEINTFDYKEFSEHRKIGEGGCGIVYEAKWKGKGM
ncbi:12028_t:CDS:2, partial [Racocetra fulgida]